MKCIIVASGKFAVKGITVAGGKFAVKRIIVAGGKFAATYKYHVNPASSSMLADNCLVTETMVQYLHKIGIFEKI